MTHADWPEAAIRGQLGKILASSGFSHNARMCQFLRFVVERSLEGRDPELKESLIGLEVFGRKADYDPKLDSIVRTEAARLRARLTEYYAKEGRPDDIVIEIPRGGYVPVFRSPAAAASTTAVPQPATTRLRRAWLGIPLAAVLLVISTGVWWVARDTRAPIQIAVLPFLNFGAAADDYFADGLTDEVIHDLALIDGLSVRSRTSSFAFRNQSSNTAEVARQLHVAYLVEGSVLRMGDRARIETRIIRTIDDTTVWANRFDRQLADIFAIQDEIAVGVVNNFRLQIGRGRRRYETSTQAYDLYLQARASAAVLTPPFDRFIDAFDRVIAKDPSFAPAYAGLASVYAVQSAQFPINHSPEELTRMRSAAERALQLDPLLAEAHAALGLADAREARWQEAEGHFRKAISLDGNRAQTFTDFTWWHLAVLGRHDEALAQMRAAETTDPLSSDVHRTFAMVLINLGRFDEAAVHCKKMSPGSQFKPQCLARVSLGLGRAGEAVEILSHDPDVAQNPQGRGLLGYAYAKAGRRDEAERMAAVANFANEQALIYAGLGNQDRTLAALDRMTSVGAQRLGQYLGYPEMALLRGDPRVVALRQKAGLIPPG